MVSQTMAGFRESWAPDRQAQTAVFASALLLEVFATLFGGASQTNALSLLAVEVASLPLLFVSVYLMLARAGPRGALLPIILMVLVILVPIAQLIPLPASIWTGLPGRGAMLQVLDAANLGRPSLPYSLTPQDTWRSALGLAPPAAMFMGAMLLSDAQRRVMAGLWLALATISLLIGVLQILGGPNSPLYFYDITNEGSPVGLFSNRNHNASFLLCLLPVAAVFAAEFRGIGEDWRAIPPLLAVLYFLIGIVGVAVMHSRAGVFLLIPALIGSVAVVVTGGALRGRIRAAAGLAAGAAVAVGAVLIFGFAPILDRFYDTGELRFEGWPIVVKAAQSYLPFGSGIGSFDTVYRSVEPLTQVSTVYFNHAHNDYLELFLETGLVGAALFALFAIWFLIRAFVIWTQRDGEGRNLAAALTVLVVLLLAHSLLDYPLRTQALAGLFAFACGAMAAYRPAALAARPKSRTVGAG
ncbi:MAG TPA: O-antigen ligase family protein [Caulobacteraceae bacterium]|jgi:O-antigen ligase|nr:O-antigen ligase family protein [Caulobacteraceae bacterium]HEX4096508.1 O-antigen ligase family protein [Caulobacteraceae bacterium]